MSEGIEHIQIIYSYKGTGELQKLFEMRLKSFDEQSLQECSQLIRKTLNISRNNIGFFQKFFKMEIACIANDLPIFSITINPKDIHNLADPIDFCIRHYSQKRMPPRKNDWDDFHRNNWH